MPKLKSKSSRFEGSCVAEALHMDMDVSAGLELQHMSRVQTVVRTVLVQKGLDPSHLQRDSKKKLCIGCITAILQPDTASARSSQTQTETAYVLDPSDVDSFVEQLDPILRSKVAFALGKYDKKTVRNDALRQFEQRSLDTLLELDPAEYSKDSTSVLNNFLKGLASSTNTESQQNIPIEEPSEMYELCKATEACMALTTPVKVLPFHFRELILVYSLTRSRLALSLLGSGSPYGSYQAVKAWLRSANSDLRPDLTNAGDLLAVFDNNQVLQRRWKITLNNNVKCSVITMVAFVDITQEEPLMFKEELVPGRWMWQDLPPDGEVKLKEQEHHARQFLYQHHLHQWLTAVMKEVGDDQVRAAGGTFNDDIDVNVAHQRHIQHFKTCTNCGDNEMPKRNRVCRKCNATVSAAASRAAEEQNECTASSSHQTGKPGLPLIQVQSQRWINKKKTLKKPPTKELKFDYSGDIVKKLSPLDPTKPRLEYEGLKELEDADDVILKIFSLEFGDGRDLLRSHVDQVKSKIQEHPADIRSYEVKIADLTVKIRNQMRHVLDFRKDKWGKSLLINRIQYRHRNLRLLRSRDYEKFLWITKELQLQYIPLNEYNRKLSKRATRIKVARDAMFAARQQKLENFKAQLEQEKEVFLVEKEKELERIENELKELGIDAPLTSPEEVYKALGVGEPYLPKRERKQNRRQKLLAMKFELYAHRRYSKIDTPT